MSHKFLPWESSKPGFTRDATALEILNNYAKVNLQDEVKVNKSKSTGRPGLNYIYEYGGVLVYDVKAEVVPGCPPVDKITNITDFPIQEINESSN